MNWLDADTAHQVLAYDASTGLLRWRIRMNYRCAEAGSIAGHRNRQGYITVGFGGRLYQAHRVIWLMAFGRWPSGPLDHINGVRDDNRLCNLREATVAINNQNKRRAYRTSKTGLPGVTKKSLGGGFQAAVTTNGRHTYLGTFATAAAAHEAYLIAKRRLHAGCTV